MRAEDRSRNIIIGIVFVIIILLLVVYLARKRQADSTLPTFSPIPTPVTSFESQIKNNFGLTLPVNAVKADLKDVTGGNQVGLATFDSSNNTYTILANLETPVIGYFYQAWLTNNSDAISLGQLSLAKGGWLTNFKSNKNITDHKQVLITLEKISDTTPEKHILEGSF